MDYLGLVFGCLDFIVTPAGDYVFLEINEMGQFLFLERRTELPLLESFTQFLLAGSEHFRLTSSKNPVSYAEVWSEALDLAEQARADHVTPRDETALSPEVEVNL
jgi:hypothetical protein